MDEVREKFLSRINDSIEWHYKRYRQFLALQWSVMILVAIAGVFTTFAGLPERQEFWYAQSDSLLIWGLITAVGAGINQLGNPGKSSERHLKTKLALKAIRGAVEFRNLPIERADQCWAIARIDPERAVEELNHWRSSEQAVQEV